MSRDRSDNDVPVVLVEMDARDSTRFDIQRCHAKVDGLHFQLFKRQNLEGLRARTRRIYHVRNGYRHSGASGGHDTARLPSNGDLLSSDLVVMNLGVNLIRSPFIEVENRWSDQQGFGLIEEQVNQNARTLGGVGVTRPTNQRSPPSELVVRPPAIQ